MAYTPLQIIASSTIIGYLQDNSNWTKPYGGAYKTTAPSLSSLTQTNYYVDDIYKYEVVKKSSSTITTVIRIQHSDDY